MNGSSQVNSEIPAVRLVLFKPENAIAQYPSLKNFLIQGKSNR
jgi:hypothetical protein